MLSGSKLEFKDVGLQSDLNMMNKRPCRRLAKPIDVHAGPEMIDTTPYLRFINRMR